MDTRRTFSLDDQRAFAYISGDANPLHVDPIAARRTIFEHPVVHGVHVLLWAIDRWLAGAPDGVAGVVLESIRAAFKQPAIVGVEVALAIDAPAPDRVRLIATAGDARVLDATLTWRLGAPAAAAVAAPAWAAAPRLVERDAIAGEHGETPLALDAAAATTRFPHAVDRLGASVVALLAAATRVVGMDCPGLHSVFAGLELARAADPEATAADTTLAWRVARANLRYSIVDVAVHGGGYAGTLAALYRPVPPAGPTTAEVRAAIGPAELAGQRALVVGGTRGLGEAIARAAAWGGADVCLTYHRGAADAERVIAACDGAPGAVRACALDVTAPAPLTLAWPFAAPPTHVYYLASPRIPGIGRYRRAELDLMLRYYVDGLDAVATAVCALGARDAVIWTPSTVFLTDGGGSAAYAMAKAAMEELCRRLPRALPVRVRAPRLPRIATDQTAALIQMPAAPALDVAVAELRAAARPDA